MTIRTSLAAIVSVALFAVTAVAEDARYFKIVHKDTGKVMAVADDSADDKAKIVLAKDEGTEAQQWKLEKDGDSLKIVNRKSGKVIDVNEASKDEDAEIIQYEAKGEDNDNQRWSWVGDAAKRLKSKHSGLVLDVVDGNVTQKKSDDKANSQVWEAVEVKK